jgi:hypothetical protein
MRALAAAPRVRVRTTKPGKGQLAAALEDGLNRWIWDHPGQFRRLQRNAGRNLVKAILLDYGRPEGPWPMPGAAPPGPAPMSPLEALSNA